MGETFSREEKLGIYMQLYNLAAGDKAKPEGTVEYEIFKIGTNEKVFEYSEELQTLPGASTQLTIEKLLPLKDLEPGKYQLKIKVVDKIRNQTLTPSATFTVTS
jgi:hypothetical protein